MSSIFGLNDPPEEWPENDVTPPAVDSVDVPRVDAPRTADSLGPCPDCGRLCSKQAESCPSCGRFFRNYSRVIEVVPGPGWVAKVAWGVVLSSFLWGAIIVALFMAGLVILAILGGAGAALSPPR